MSTSAFCSLVNFAAVNADLEAQGFGPGNFSVPIYDGGTRATHAVLHAWAGVKNNSGTLFLLDVLNADPRVTVLDSETGIPRDRVRTLVTDNGLAWPDDAPFLPDAGTINPGSYFKYLRGLEIEFWLVIQQHDRGVFGGDPNQYPALIRQARIPRQVAPWVQPLDQFDAYLTIDPFTGQGEQVTHNGQTWRCVDGSAGGPGGSLLNTWEPGVFGWTVV